MTLTATVSTVIATGAQTLPGPLAPGEYILTLKDSNDPDCMTSSTEVPDYFDNLTISPNPFTDELNIQLETPNSKLET